MLSGIEGKRQRQPPLFFSSFQLPATKPCNAPQHSKQGLNWDTTSPEHGQTLSTVIHLVPRVTPLAQSVAPKGEENQITPPRGHKGTCGSESSSPCSRGLPRPLPPPPPPRLLNPEAGEESTKLQREEAEARWNRAVEQGRRCQKTETPQSSCSAGRSPCNAAAAGTAEETTRRYFLWLVVAGNKKDWFFLPAGLCLLVSGFKSFLFSFVFELLVLACELLCCREQEKWFLF